MPVRTQQRTNKLGLEVTERIIWQGWQPGGEYTKNITLKNVDIKAKKLKYKIPATRFFTTKYPQPIILSSGTSLNLPVTFRPLEKGTYEDQIVFETKDGKFSIPMTAALPEAELLLPDAIDFDLCAVGDRQQKSFEILNISDLEISFNISCERPFDVRLNQGSLLPNSKRIVTVEFKPEGAFVYNLEAVCTFGADNGQIHKKRILLQGTGKYAYIGVKYGQQVGHHIEIDFKSVPINTTSENVIELINYTPVSAPYQVIQPSLDSSIDKAYACSQYHGTVPGNGTVNIKVSYTPSIIDVQQADSFEILALGATSCATVKCIGRGKGPKVSFEVSSLSFGLTEISTDVTRSFKIMNDSQVEAFFQLQLDNDCSVFNCDVKSGRLKGGASQTIIVTFKPEKPINYYRKVTWLIHNQGPLYLDLFGTCHTDQVTPGVLQRKHIERYQIHNSRGLTRVSPEDLRSWLQEGRLAVGDDGCLNIKDELLNDELYQPNTDDGPMEEFFNDGTIGELVTVSPHVSVDVRYVEFSRCNPGQVYHKTINVTNHNQGKISCIWNSGKKGNPFAVHPSEMDILPLQSASFSVRFKPNVSGQFFSAELEGYAFYKSIRDHRLVEDITFCPPWCLTTIASGHTFTAKNETFLPQCQMDSSVIFAPVTSVQPSYKTLLLTRNGTNPIDFAFDEDESRTFSCKPSKGLLRDKYQIVVFRYIPDDFGTCSRKLNCILNASEKHAKNISLVGSAETPSLQIQTQEAAYFQPTYVGTSSNVKITVKNPCRIPLRFEWKIPAADKEMLSVEPASGSISSNETQIHTWSFKPKSETKYLFKVKLAADSIDRIPGTQQRQTLLRLIGEGQKGSLSCQPEKLDFGDVVVGSSIQKVIQLQNESDCGLHFLLKIDAKIPGTFEVDETSTKVLQLSDYRGFLPARSRKTIEVKMHPRQRCEYICKIFCQLLSSQENVNTSDDTADLGTCLCTVTVTGVYPTLAVNDIRGIGCAHGYSRKYLWELFSIDRFNSCLDSDPSSQELIYKVPTRHSTRRRMPVHTRAVLDFNFGSSLHLSDSCEILVNLQNTGSAVAEWNFLFPTDLQLDMEFWAQTGEFEEDELHEMFVLDHSLFSIHPKKGSLSPGKSQVVLLSYSHSAVGIHKLPVLFKVSKGREILLNFIGHTVSPEEKHLHFSTTKHMFDSVPIGRSTPPVQFFPLYNGGGQPVEFHLDISPLDELQEKNCGWRILECLNPTGVIPPGQTQFVSWIFSPLEAKTYSVDVMIYTVGGESTFVTFTGIGYDPALMGPTMALADSANDSLPKKQLITVPDQLLYLSEERLSFDNVPLLSEVKRVIFLKNISTEFAVTFRWLLDSSPESEVLSIEPSQGYIKPSDYAICKVKFLSKGPPAIYDMDCLCEVANETLMAKYNKELLQWHQKEEDKKVHFTITESDIDKAKTRPGSGPTKLKSIEASKRINRSESDLRKYDALPPIGTASNDASISDATHPKPPDTFSVHMSVTARTHSIEEFCSSFINIADQFFIKGNSPKDSKSTKNVKVEKRNCSKDEYAAITSIIPLLVMDLLEDKDFQNAIKTVHEEPIPYFGMIASEDSSELRKLADGGISNEESPEFENRAAAEVEAIEEDAAELDVDQISVKKEGNTLLDTDQAVGTTIAATITTTTIAATTTTETIDPSTTEPSVIGDSAIVDGTSEESKMQETEHAETERTGTKSTEDSTTTSLLERQMLKCSDEFAKLLEEVFENTIFNIMSEASKMEINLTSRPRLVALPPSAKGDRKSYQK